MALHPCSPHSRRFRLGLATGLALGLAIAAGHGHAAEPLEFEGLRIEVVGQSGPALLMIPGLNSAADVWQPTCAALQPTVQCHIVQLPGFAGQPPVGAEPWLEAMRDRLLRYVDAAGLEQPAVVGHSLGGALALSLAIRAPHRFERLVVVDSLPFFGAAANPAATVETVRPIAEGMRAGMLAVDEARYRAQAQLALAGMSNQPERMETLLQWGESSDRATTAQAMYELMVTDLRPQLDAIRVPTLVLGAWAGYAAYGATAESVRATFERQYAALDGVRIELSDGGYHFLMWDDPLWLQAQLRDFLDLPAH